MSKKILVVEDDKFLRELVARKIDAEGYETIQAEDGQSGLKKIKETKPDLILLDLVMPGLTGYDFLNTIKKDSEASKIPIIVLSNLGQREDVEKAIDLGAKDFLIKAHFTPQEILEKIKKFLP